MNTQTEIIYIAGYGRSGSTLLERLLQCEPRIRAAGELANFFKLYGCTSSRCSCGASINNCSFWNKVAEKLVSSGYPVQNFPVYAKVQNQYEAHWAYGGKIVRQDDQAYPNLMKPFFHAMMGSLENEETVLVDSSKTAYTRPYRPLLLSKIIYKVKVIHLVRDCRGVAWSIKKGLNRRLEAGINERARLPVTRAMAGWVHANLAAGKLKKLLGEENYYFLRYEDLADNPVHAMKKLESFLCIDLKESVAAAQKATQDGGLQLQQMHQLAGNRMRFSTNLSIKPDYQWKEMLNRPTVKFIEYMLWPLMKKYGYL